MWNCLRELTRWLNYCTQTDQQLKLMLKRAFVKTPHQWLMTQFIVSWHAGKIEMYLYLFSEDSLEVSHAGDAFLFWTWANRQWCLWANRSCRVLDSLLSWLRTPEWIGPRHPASDTQFTAKHFNAPVTRTIHTPSDLPHVKHVGTSTQNALGL